MIKNDFLFTEHFPEISGLDFSRWKADWLENDINGVYWKIKTDKKKSTEIRFDDYLADGSKLSDKKYINLVKVIKKVVFLMRQGAYAEFNQGNMITRATQQYELARSLKIIVKYAVSQGIKIALIGFQGLTNSIFEHFNSLAIFGSETVDGSLQLVRTFLTNAQENENLQAYQTTKGSLNFVKIFKKMGMEKNIKSHRAIFELKKFRSKPLEKYAFTRQGQELINVEAVPYEEVANQPISESTLSGLHLGWKALAKFSLIIPGLERLKWASEINSKKIAINLGAREKQRTKTIPIQTALEYLNHSLKFVADYGDILVELKQDCDEQLMEMFDGTTGKKDHYCKQINILRFSSNDKQRVISDLNIVRYNRNTTSTPIEIKRSALGLEEACDCLVAACYILIGTFSCKRIDEVLSLTEDCTRPALDGGWELVFGLEKASPAETLALIGRPIPDVVKKAIDLLNDMSPKPENEESALPLFKNNLNISRKPQKIISMSGDILYRKLDLFADIIEITPTLNKYPESRRWYLKTHQLRRFFAISYFWHSSFSNLAALTWFMGHSDPEMTMRYIEEEIGAEEFSDEEARFAAEMINDENNCGEGIEILREEVKSEFRVNDIQLISRTQLENFLIKKFNQGAKIFKTYSDQKEETNILFLEVEND
jgi:hypothetical protein